LSAHKKLKKKRDHEPGEQRAGSRKQREREREREREPTD
jgi:hypothetical protein